MEEIGIGRGPVAGAALGLVLLALGAPWLGASYPAAGLAIRGFFSGLCHQDPARSFAIGAFPVAVCVRCLGIYAGVAAGAVLSGRLRRQKSLAVRFFLVGLLLNGADVAAEGLHLHGNLPLLRFPLGALLGMATGVLLTLPFTGTSGANQPAAGRFTGFPAANRLTSSGDPKATTATRAVESRSLR
jgi:uncharacterized membrane protein